MGTAPSGERLVEVMALAGRDSEPPAGVFWCSYRSWIHCNVGRLVIPVRSIFAVLGCLVTMAFVKDGVSLLKEAGHGCRAARYRDS
jgi:hypothetical protein